MLGEQNVLKESFFGFRWLACAKRGAFATVVAIVNIVTQFLG